MIRKAAAPVLEARQMTASHLRAQLIDKPMVFCASNMSSPSKVFDGLKSTLVFSIADVRRIASVMHVSSAFMSSFFAGRLHGQLAVCLASFAESGSLHGNIRLLRFHVEVYPSQLDRVAVKLRRTGLKA